MIKNELIIRHPSESKTYNFSRPIDTLDVRGQGQPIIINNKIFKDKIKNGFYIEAGAFDGELRSNSLFYELKKGWDGLLVEANPDAFQELKSKVLKLLLTILNI